MRETFDVNGESEEFTLSPADTLLSVLRKNGHTEVKNGCEEGLCGACMVLIGDDAVPSCQVLALSVKDKKIRTVKALGSLHDASVIQKAFVDEGAVQCGFCASGMTLSAWALLAKNPRPSENDIRSALDGNLCRCTGYVKTVKAVQRAAEEIRKLNGRPEGKAHV